MHRWEAKVKILVEKYDDWVCSGLNRFRIETGGGLLGTGNEPSGSMKGATISFSGRTVLRTVAS